MVVMMLKRASVLAAVLTALVLPPAPAWAQSAPPADLDLYVEQTLEAFGVPAMAIAIVGDGQDEARAYGVRRMGRSEAVDPHTLFPIGSNTKAFTVAALALLVDEGKLSWEDRVADRLPGFRLFDPYVTRELTVRDLLTHRSGLGVGAGDLLIFPETRYSRAEIVHRLRDLKPETSFRSVFAYDNVLYIVAGELIEAVAGEPWETFVHRRIFNRLGMDDATTTFGEITTENRGWPHARISRQIRGLGPIAPLPTVPNIDNEAPAGTINASATDMTRWLSTLVNRGGLPDGSGRLFSAERSAEMWTPQVVETITPAPPELSVTTPNFMTYALGWNVYDYRGHRIISHGGGVYGGVSTVMVIPERNIGIAVMTNAEERFAVNAVLFKLMDHYLGLEPTDWIAPSVTAREARLARGEAALAAARIDVGGPAGGQGRPSLESAAYVGTYIDPWYGTMTISGSEGGLRISFDPSVGMIGDLTHVRYDTFQAHWDDRSIEDAYLTFSLGPDGQIREVRAAPVSPLADPSFNFKDLAFTPVAAAPSAR